MGPRKKAGRQAKRRDAPWKDGPEACLTQGVFFQERASPASFSLFTLSAEILLLVACRCPAPDFQQPPDGRDRSKFSARSETVLLDLCAAPGSF